MKTNRITLIGSLIVALSACSDRTNSPSITAPEADASVAPGVAAYAGYVMIPPIPGPAFLTASAEAYGINNNKVIVGRSDRTVTIGGTSCTTKAAFMFDAVAGTMNDLLLPLGLPFACAPVSVALDVNNANVAVGWFANGAGTSAFMSVGGGMPTILASPAIKTIANAINDAGVAVGFINDPAIGKHAVKWIGPFAMVDIHPAGWVSSEAVDISNTGVITGIACNAANCYVARWNAAGGFVASPKIIGKDVATISGFSVRPLSVNLANVIAGSELLAGVADYPFSWSGGAFGLPGIPPTRVAEMSDLFRTVGSNTSAAGLRTAYTRRLGVTTALPGPVVKTEMWATGVNQCGDVVGNVRNGAKTRVILWQNIPCD